MRHGQERRSLLTCALALLAGAYVAVTMGGCGAPRASGPYTTQSADARDPRKADELNARAADVIDRDPQQAEALLREALTADIYHGPAHNNLGTLYLAQGKLYEAASEFEWARKLLPGHPDPRMNLALTLESAGRTDEALATYETALEVYPQHLPSMQALARLRVRSGMTGDRTRELLQQVAFKSEDAQWRDWARMQLAKEDL
ncbi:MAG: tetratricopeptide repeat protein [Phycisphaerales bacterium]|nr:tetratricopeptide repeat protein [Phycisphaerales bacterium]